jgi:polyisoprenoid-binding protein YceI
MTTTATTRIRLPHTTTLAKPLSTALLAASLIALSALSAFSPMAQAQTKPTATAKATTPATAPATLLTAQSSLGFAITQMGVPVQGQFKKFDAKVNFDPAKPATGHIGFTVDVGSASLGSREADAEMPKPVWFNAVQFPQASFQSSTIKALGAGKFEVAGKLSIKGASRDVVVPVTLTQTGTAPALTTTASGTFSIPRLAFKVGEAEWADTSMVADAVAINFKLVMTGMGKL